MAPGKIEGDCPTSGRFDQEKEEACCGTTKGGKRVCHLALHGPDGALAFLFCPSGKKKKKGDSESHPQEEKNAVGVPPGLCNLLVEDRPTERKKGGNTSCWDRGGKEGPLW